MPWLAGSFGADDDLLEPLDPDTGEPLDPDSSGFGRGELDISSSSRPKPGRMGRRALRLYLLAGSLGMLSLFQLVGAVHVRNVHRDLRHVEEVWRTALAVDDDRAEAERAIDGASREFGYTRSLTDQRRDLLDAEAARLAKLDDALANERVSTQLGRDLRDSMRAALQARRHQLDRRNIPITDRSFPIVSAELATALDRWRLGERVPEADAVLTTAAETIERLSHYADEPTGLVLAGVSTKGLYLIDVDNDRVATHALDLSTGLSWRDVGLVAFGNVVVVHSNDVAHAFRITSIDEVGPLWQRPADTIQTTTDGHLWLQHDDELVRIDAAGNDASKVIRLEANAWLGATQEGDAVVITPDGEFASFAPDGGKGVDLEFAHAVDDGRGFWASSHGDWAVGLSDGRILLARIDDERVRPMRLRAPLPRLLGVAAVDV